MDGRRSPITATTSRPRPPPSSFKPAALLPWCTVALLLLALAAEAATAFHASVPSRPRAVRQELHRPTTPRAGRRRHYLSISPLQAAAAADTAGGSATAVIRERLLDGEREGALVVSTGRFPLIGLPAWSPPLHVGVLLSVEDKGGKGRTLGAGGDGGGALSPGYFLLDFVPAEPTAPATAMALLSGRRVPGVVRDKLLVAALPKMVVRRGRCRRSLIEIRAFCRGYDAQLRLVGNNCQTFVEALLAFVVEEDEDEGEGEGGAGEKNDEDDLDEAASVLEWILGDD